MPAGPKLSTPLGVNSHCALLVHLRGIGRSSWEWKWSSVTSDSVPAPRQQLSGRLAVFQSLGQSASRFRFWRALSWPTSLDIPLMAFQPPRKMPAAETRTSVAGRRRKRRVTNWLHAADWRCEANRHRKRVMQEIKDAAIFRGPAKCHSDGSLWKTTRTAGVYSG
jgi:hypothetical protein